MRISDWSSDVCAADLHFKYWRIAGDPTLLAKATKTVEDFIEIGLLVTDITQIEKIRLYVPTRIRLASVEDCAPYLAQSQFAQGIFNEVFKITAPVAGQIGNASGRERVCQDG